MDNRHEHVFLARHNGGMDPIATTPEPPYYAVIFSSQRNAVAGDGYDPTADRMVELAHEQDGFLGVEHARDDLLGITVCYWRDEASIAAWKAQAEHDAAQREGRAGWYHDYALRVARVERAYDLATSTYDEST
jgi:heme-degrading monooxygenase HmoA